MPRGRPIILLLLVAVPFATGGSPLVLLDPEGDQEFEVLFTGALFHSQQTGGVLEPFAPYADVCDDPRADINDIVASATSERIRLEVAVTDPTASVTCEGVPIKDLPQMDRYPFFSIVLHRGASGGSSTQMASAYSLRLADGSFEQCVQYNEVGLRVCEPQEARVIDFPTVVVTPEGGVADLRGSSYRISAYSVDAYGSWEPDKSKPVVFFDHVTPTPGFPFEVPSGS